MKLILISLIISYVSAASFDHSWINFKLEHHKSYQNLEEETLRHSVWINNLKHINQHNLEAIQGKHTYTLKMNQFGDLSKEEISRLFSGLKMNSNFNNLNSFLIDPNKKIPDSIDWRTKGYVTSVKNQFQCGSCWAFTAIASLEGQHFKYSGKLVTLSAQNLLDCDTNDFGCNGGLMTTAYEYIKKNKGIDTDDSYPYNATDNKCRFNKTNIAATVSGYKIIKPGDENALINAIATIGPIALAIDASSSNFAFYSSGIYSDPNCSTIELNHSATAVGYGTLNGTEYYLVKNSWETSWGENGYFMIARNSNNMCGVATLGSYPII